MSKSNCTFHSFRESGKWYATGRGVLTADVFRVWETVERRDHIVKDNEGCYPGLSSAGDGYVFVVIPDEGCPHGFPLMLYPPNGRC